MVQRFLWLKLLKSIISIESSLRSDVTDPSAPTGCPQPYVHFVFSIISSGSKKGTSISRRMPFRPARLAGRHLSFKNSSKSAQDGFSTTPKARSGIRSVWALLYFQIMPNQILAFKYSTSSQTVVSGLLCREIGSIPWFWIWLARVFAL